MLPPFFENADLADKMHTVENEVYRLSNCASTNSPAAVPTESSSRTELTTSVQPSSACSSFPSHENNGNQPTGERPSEATLLGQSSMNSVRYI